MKKNNKKILIISPHLHQKGGVSNFYNNLKPYLDGSHQFFFRGLKNDNVSAFYRYIIEIINVFRFFILMSSNGYKNVVFNNSLSLASVFRDCIYLLITSVNCSEYMIFFHGWHDDLQKRNHFKFLYKYFILNSKKIIVLSDMQRQELISFGYKREIVVETTSVDDSIVPAKFKFRSDDKEINLLFLSRIEQDKGIFELIDAFRILQKKHRNVTLNIAGDGTCLGIVREIISREEINNINTLGYIINNEKKNAFMKADIFCFPSYGEGMPISVLEASAFGIPIISTRVGGLIDVFLDNESIVFLENLLPDHIAQKIEFLIDNPKIRNKLSENSFKLAKKKFYASVVAERIMALFR